MTPKTSTRNRPWSASVLVLAFASFSALCLGALSPARAQPFPACDSSPGQICTMTIRIFNNSPNHFIFPVLTTGKGPVDIWMQAWFKLTQPVVDAGTNPYPRNKNYRLYMNPTKGIAPGTGVTVSLPLYTKIASTINSAPSTCDPNKVTCTDTFIDWWNGGTVLLYTSPIVAGSSPPSAPQPPGIADALARTGTGTDGAKTQRVITIQAADAVLPTCGALVSGVAPPTNPPPCADALTVYSDVADLPKADGDQLIEYTLGARNINSADTRKTNGDIAYTLDTANVDFDVSYVNIAWAPAVVGVLGNNQVGYTGTPQTVDAFKAALRTFQQSQPGYDGTTNPPTYGWPQFVRTYEFTNPSPNPFTFLKFPSPLEIFARLSPPGAGAPPDLTPAPQWPTKLWPAIEQLRTSWKTNAGTVTAIPTSPYYTATTGNCTGIPDPSHPITDWCNAIVAAKQILLVNYTKYRELFATGKCPGTPINIDDNVLIAHVYGWTPWTEANPGAGCAAAQNLMQDTPGYFDIVHLPRETITDYTKYLNVKKSFDALNYGTNLTLPQYVFNPWVKLIHTDLKIPCAYAYSVDDALGNVQAEGQGFIVDVGSTVNLENQHECAAPITVGLGYSPNDATRFTYYALCDPAKKKPINPSFPAFVLNSYDPASCPIYLWDNGVKADGDLPAPGGLGQQYVFMVDKNPNQDIKNLFPYIENTKATPPVWAPNTSGYPPPPPPPQPATSTAIACPVRDIGPVPPYQTSSANWCCDSVSKAGIYAYATPDPLAVHAPTNYFVITQPAAICKTFGPTHNAACNVTKGYCSHGIAPSPALIGIGTR